MQITLMRLFMLCTDIHKNVVFFLMVESWSFDVKIAKLKAILVSHDK